MLCVKTLDLVVKECGENIAIGVVTDVTKKSDHEALLARALTVFGRVDVWVKNAGAGQCRLTLDLTEEDFDLMMSVNCKSALYGMQTIIPYFKQQSRGHVINVTSLLSHMPTAAPLYSMYSASKAALNSLTANMHTDNVETGKMSIAVACRLLSLDNQPIYTYFGATIGRLSRPPSPRRDIATADILPVSTLHKKKDIGKYKLVYLYLV